MKRWPLVASFVLFIALCVSIAFWGMQLFTPPLRAVAAPPQTAQPTPKLDAAAGLFGGRSSVAATSNYQLKGVIVADNANESVAILTMDGKPAQSIVVNSELVPGIRVKEVHPRYVILSDGGVAKRVNLPDEAKGQDSMNIVGSGNAVSAPVPVQSARPPVMQQPVPQQPMQSVQPAQVVQPQTIQIQPAQPAPSMQSAPVVSTAPAVNQAPNQISNQAQQQAPASSAPAVQPAPASTPPPRIGGFH